MDATMMKISALAVAVFLIGAIVDGPAALAQTTGTPNSGAGASRDAREQVGSSRKAATKSERSIQRIRIQVKFLGCLETNPGLHHKSRPSSNSYGRGLLFAQSQRIKFQ
jgi:hypothetical protein